MPHSRSMHLAALMPWPLPKVRPEVRIFQPPWRLMCLPHQDSLRQLLECHQSWESSLSSSVSMWDMSPWCLPPLTGLVKGNGTSAFTAAVAGDDYLSPSSVIDGGTY